MRIFILILVGFIPIFGKAQGADTIVINLNLRYSTIKTLANQVKISDVGKYFKVFTKWSATIKGGTEPADNANVQVDTIHTLLVVSLYEFLNANPSLKVALNDFKTSITSKRNTNSYLDSLCTATETRYSNMEADLKTYGRKLLLGL